MQKSLHFFKKIFASGKFKEKSGTPFFFFSAVISILSFVIFFIADIQFFISNQPRTKISFFQLLLNAQMRLSINGENHIIPFNSVRIFALFSLILPALTLCICFFQRKIARKMSETLIKIIHLFILVLTLFCRILVISRLLPAGFYNSSNLTSSDIRAVSGLYNNLFLIIYMLFIFFAVLSCLGIRFKMRALSYPYFLWILIFTIIPLLLILFSAFLVKRENGSYFLSLEGFQILFSDKTVQSSFYGMTLHLQEYFSVFLRSVDYAIWTTIGCLILAYPLAYILASRTRRLHQNSSLLLLFFIVPMWINTLLRTYAWRSFFGQTGVLNEFLLSINLISEPILFLKGSFPGDAVIKLVLINDFLPFMLLPVYSVLVKLDENVRQAAVDLGANQVQAFRKVTLPLSMPGVISGIQMVFMPALTFYMIPDIMSEGSISTIGLTVQNFILNESTAQQQAGKVLSLLLLIFVLSAMRFLQKADGGGTSSQTGMSL